MVGHEAGTNRVFAMANNGLTYMSSGDGGLTWASTRTSDVIKAQGLPTYKASINVPWSDDVGLVANSPATNYIQSPFGGKCSVER